MRPGKTLGIEKPFFSLTAGKFTVPFFRPRAIMGSEMVFDEDLAPEGLSEEITLLEGKAGDVMRSIKLVAGQWAAKEFAEDRDSFMLGEQIQVALAPSAKTQLTFAAADYYFHAVRCTGAGTQPQCAIVNDELGHLAGWDGGARGRCHCTNNQNPIKRFAGGFHIFNVGAQFAWDTGYAKWPFSMMVDVAHNFQSKIGDDNAYL